MRYGAIMAKTRIDNQLIRTGFHKAKQTFSYQNNQLIINIHRNGKKNNPREHSFEQKIRESCVHDIARASRVARRNPRDYFQMNFPNPGYFQERDVLYKT